MLDSVRCGTCILRIFDDAIFRHTANRVKRQEILDRFVGGVFYACDKEAFVAE